MEKLKNYFLFFPKIVNGAIFLKTKQRRFDFLFTVFGGMTLRKEKQNAYYQNVLEKEQSANSIGANNDLC